jgi:hypothetical protein
MAPLGLWTEAALGGHVLGQVTAVVASAARIKVRSYQFSTRPVPILSHAPYLIFLTFFLEAGLRWEPLHS